jgi:NTE family protein
MRANSMPYRQSTAVRTRWMVDRFVSGSRSGTLFKLATNVDRHGGDIDRFVDTVFDRLDRELCTLPVYRGWWLAGAHLARWHASTYPLPAMDPPPIT